ncbi:MAG: FdhD protein [Thermomicrobiales bacterium]|nr:FdhD protein [Thermomicrobiales bacterium]
MEGRRRGQTRARVRVVEGGRARLQKDVLATEEPLEIRLHAGGATRPVAVTMRTPGADFELAAGFLFSEGLISGREDVDRLSYCVGNDACDGEQQYNVVTVDVRPHVAPDPALFDRNFGVTSACGICGKSSLDQVERRGIASLGAGPVVSHEVLYGLPDKLRDAQGLFATTGGLHAAGLFTVDGELIALREDVGRHNAVDKLIGWALLEGKLPLSEQIVMVSGRSSFEIAQKCVAAGVPILCAVSAPSSLAVDLAKRFGLTLVGFLRGDRFNVYNGAQRIGLADAP